MDARTKVEDRLRLLEGGAIKTAANQPIKAPSASAQNTVSSFPSYNANADIQMESTVEKKEEEEKKEEKKDKKEKKEKKDKEEKKEKKEKKSEKRHADDEETPDKKSKKKKHHDKDEN